MSPASLRCPDSPLAMENCWRQLSSVLFEELRLALSSDQRPTPKELEAALAKWGRYDPGVRANVISRRTVKDWISAYALAFKQSGKEEIKGSPYVVACANLLRNRVVRELSVPVVFVQFARRAGVVALLKMAVTRGAKSLSLHPSFAHRRHDLEAGTGNFEESISNAWTMAAAATDAKVSILWCLTSIDGTPLPPLELDGASASGAAYRAFWHALNWRALDEEVFILCEAVPGGCVAPVANLALKLHAIEGTQTDSDYIPPTVVVHKALPETDGAFLQAANGWADCVTIGTLEELSLVRSCGAKAVVKYLEAFAAAMDQSKWVLGGKRILMSEVSVPHFVWKNDRQCVGFDYSRLDQGATQYREEDWRPNGHDTTSVAREVAPGLDMSQRQWRVPWDEELQRMRNDTFVLTVHISGDQHWSERDESYRLKRPAIVVGGPGFGKTSLLRYSARMIALAGSELAERRGADLGVIHWPFLIDLPSLANSNESALSTLISHAIYSVGNVGTWSKMEIRALRGLLRRRLENARKEKASGAGPGGIFVFLDALDQVPCSLSAPLTEQLKEIEVLTNNIVITSREVGISLHALPWDDPLQYQMALLDRDDGRSLRQKLLDPEDARILENHLEKWPALSTVRGSPLLHTLACLVMRNRGGEELPQTPFGLYRRILRMMLRGVWRSSTHRSSDTDVESMLGAVETLAWRLFYRYAGENRFEHSLLVGELKSIWGHGLETATAELKSLVDLGILETSGYCGDELSYCFTHNSFGEFLAAAFISKTVNGSGHFSKTIVPRWNGDWKSGKLAPILRHKIQDPRWSTFFQFLAAGLKNPSPLIKILKNVDTHGGIDHRWTLAMQCFSVISRQDQDALDDIGLALAWEVAYPLRSVPIEGIHEGLLAVLTSKFGTHPKIASLLRDCFQTADDDPFSATIIARTLRELSDHPLTDELLALAREWGRAQIFPNAWRACRVAEILLAFGRPADVPRAMEILVAILQYRGVDLSLRCHALTLLLQHYPNSEDAVRRAIKHIAANAVDDPLFVVFAAEGMRLTPRKQLEPSLQSALGKVFHDANGELFIRLSAGLILATHGDVDARKWTLEMTGNFLEYFKKHKRLDPAACLISWPIEATDGERGRAEATMNSSCVAARTILMHSRVGEPTARIAALSAARELLGMLRDQPLRARIDVCNTLWKLGDAATNGAIVENLAEAAIALARGKGRGVEEELGEPVPSVVVAGGQKRKQASGLTEAHLALANLLVRTDPSRAFALLMEVGRADIQFARTIANFLALRGWRVGLEILPSGVGVPLVYELMEKVAKALRRQFGVGKGKDELLRGVFVSKTGNWTRECIQIAEYYRPRLEKGLSQALSIKRTDLS